MADDRDEEEQERARPRVVDKRISARPAPGEQEPASQPPPAPERPAPESGHEQPEPLLPPEAPRSTTGQYGAESATDIGPVGGPARGEQVWTPEQEAEAQRIVDEISQVAGIDWVLNSCVTLANVAGAKIQLGQLGEAEIALDALAAIVDQLGPRLLDAEAPLRQTITQLRFAYAERAAPREGP